MKKAAALLFFAINLIAADATGKWTGTFTVPTPNGEQTRPARLILKQDGTKLTGTAGPSDTEQHAIENGKAENGVITFELGDGDHRMRFALTHEGDEIKGEVSREHE